MIGVLFLYISQSLFIVEVHMVFLIMWQNINIGILSEKGSKINYKIIITNISNALEKGLIFSSILTDTYNNVLPEWINKRIPAKEKDKMEYLKKTEGRLETDEIWFKNIK